MFTTGFCNIGHHEGKSPTSPSGKPMKVCVAIEICECPCHKKINKMYEIADMPRVLQQNPKYIPAPNVDLSWLQDLDRDAATNGRPNTRPPIEQPSSAVPGLVESARVYTPTDNGYRARGQLEAEVQKICNRKMAGEWAGDLHLSPATIGELISPTSPPSSGAIGAVLNRWEAIGYAKIHRKPTYFVTYTVDGMRDGLQACKDRYKSRGGRAVR